MAIQNVGRDLMFPKALDDIQNAIEGTEKTAQELLLRLVKISQPGALSELSVNKSAPVPVQAEYVENLFVKAEQIRRIRSMLEDILANLEL